jgi:hypothetical protein
LKSPRRQWTQTGKWRWILSARVTKSVKTMTGKGYGVHKASSLKKFIFKTLEDTQVYFYKRFIWALLLLLIMFLAGCSRPVPKQDTVVRGGLLYKMGEDDPFTGIVVGKGREPRHTQRMTYKKAYKNGVQEGETTFYYPSGKVESMAPYINGEIHGILMTYWPSGRPKSRIHFVHGMRGGARGEMFWDQKGKKIRG